MYAAMYAETNQTEQISTKIGRGFWGWFWSGPRPANFFTCACWHHHFLL